MSTPSSPRQNATKLTSITTEMAAELILTDLFYRFQGSNPALEPRLRAAFKQRYGVEMHQLLSEEWVMPVYLEGSPGAGKTSSFRSACQEFAKLMGMKFLDALSKEDIERGMVGPEDFVYQVIELAGANNKYDIGGLPMRTKVGDTEFMGHLPEWKLASTMMGGYSFLVFDDFPTAARSVQASVLGMLLGSKAGDLNFTAREEDSSLPRSRRSSRVHVGLAGNQGNADGNRAVNEIDTAVMNRVQRYNVYDTIPAFKRRTLRNLTDELGDLQFTDFLEANADMFSKLEKPDSSGLRGQFPTPRSWDGFLSAARIIVAQAGGADAIASSTNTDLISGVCSKLMMRAGGFVGAEAAERVDKFYHQLFTGASRYARAIIQDGTVESDAIKARYGNGSTIEGKSFGYSFAGSLASYGSSELARVTNEFLQRPEHQRSKKTPSELLDGAISNDTSDFSKKMHEVAIRISYGLAQFAEPMLVSYAVNQLYARLAVSAPDLFVVTPSHDTVAALRSDMIVLMGTAMLADNKKHPLPDESQEAMIDLLSGYSNVIDDSGAMLAMRERITKAKGLGAA